MIELNPTERRALRARAHGLNPVVSISEKGLTEAVLKEIDNSLKAHELIKVRVYGDDRELRMSYLEEICQALECAEVQHIGKLLVLWRPDASAKAATPPAKPRKAPRRVSKRAMQGNSPK